MGAASRRSMAALVVTVAMLGVWIALPVSAAAAPGTATLALSKTALE